MRRILLALAALALALSACELRAEIALNQDGSGTLGMVFALEPEMLALFNQPGFGGDPFAELRSDLADDPVAWSVDEFTEDRLTGIRASFAFATVQDLLDKMDALDSEDGGDAAIKDLTIARRAGGWVFEGRSSDPEKELASGSVPIPIDQLATMLKVQVRVTLPGKAAEHNADEITSGGGKTTFIWKPDLKSRGVELRASTTPGGASAPVLPIGLGLTALVAVALLWLRKLRTPLPGSDPSMPSDAVSDDPKEDASLSS